jgi:hypothetical protein
MRWRDRVPALILGLVILGGIVLGGLALRPWGQVPSSAGSPEDSSGLRFENVRLAEGADGAEEQRVEFDLNWVGSEFPGAFECHWKVLNSEGAAIGQLEDTVVSLRPAAVKASVDIPVHGVAASASAECAGERLDIGDPYVYDFQVGDVVASQEGQLALGYHSTWQGKGLPGAVTCRATVLDSAGEVVASTKVNIAGEASGDSAIHLTASGVAKDDTGFSGSIDDCEPFRAPSEA